jgi:hypothetical protein
MAKIKKPRNEAELKKFIEQLKKLPDLKTDAYRMKREKEAGKKPRAKAAAYAKSEVGKLLAQQMNQGTVRDIDALLDQAWQEYKDKFQKMSMELRGRESQLNEGRRLEFETFILANQFENFEIDDNLAHYLGGDIDVENSRIQLKAVGGDFKPSAPIRGVHSQIKSWRFSKAQALGMDWDIIEGMAALELRAAIINKELDEFERGSMEQKVKIMELYLQASRADWFVLETATPPHRGTHGLSVAVPKENMLAFVRNNPQFFSVKNIPNSKLKVFNKELMFVDPGGLIPVFAVGIQKPQFSIHYRDSIKFYETKGVVASDRRSWKREPMSGYSIDEALDYKDFIEGEYQRSFRLIHDNLFGGLEY